MMVYHRLRFAAIRQTFPPSAVWFGHAQGVGRSGEILLLATELTGRQARRHRGPTVVEICDRASCR